MTMNKCLHKLKVLHYERIDVSKGIDVNKTSESKECDICFYWYFLDKGFNFNWMPAMVVVMY